MEEITRGATPVAADDPAWVDLLHVRMRYGTSLLGLIKLIGAGHFRVGLREGKPLFRNVVLQKAELDLLGRAQVDQPVGEMSASEFGRAVGLRHNGEFIEVARFICTVWGVSLSGFPPRLCRHHHRRQRVEVGLIRRLPVKG